MLRIPTADEQRLWQRDGVVPIEAAISGDELERLRTAFRRCADECRQLMGGTAAAFLHFNPPPIG